MFGATDDEDFFAQSTSSNLASLFGTTIQPPSNSKADLTYTAPKQPRLAAEEVPDRKTEKLKQQNSVLCAKPVNVYKLVDGSYASVGKYGLALIGSTAEASEVLLYKDKRNILTRAKMHANFEFSLWDEKFLSFKDDNKQPWSVRFESVKDLNEFIHNVKVCNIDVTNANAGEINRQNKSVTVDNNNIKTDLNDIMNVKSESESILNRQEHESQSDSSGSQTRANILSRMAKMGHSILPSPILQTSLLSDSETDDSIDAMKKIVNKKPKIKKEAPTAVASNGKPPAANRSSEKASTNAPSSAQFTDQQYTVINGQLVPMTSSSSYMTANYPQILQGLPNNVIMNPVVPVGSDNFSLYVTENRMCNSEMRVNLSVITTKLDSVLGEISKIKNPTSTDKLENEFLKSKIKDLETKIVYLTGKLEEPDEFKEKLMKELRTKDGEIEKHGKEIGRLVKELEAALRTREDTERLQLREEEFNRTIEELYEANKSASEMQESICSLNEQILSLSRELKNSKQIETRRKTLDEAAVKLFGDGVKQSMNVMFQNVLMQVDDKFGANSKNVIRNLLVTNMKQATYEIINRFQNGLHVEDARDMEVAENLDSKANGEGSRPPVPDFES